MIVGAGLLRAAAAIVLCGALGAADAAAPKKKNPSWNDLSAEERQILAPLAPPEWDSLEPPRKAKWLGIAKRYPNMTPTEQRRVQSRMEKWVKLTPEQRRQARESFRQMGKLPPERKQDLAKQWSEYQMLSPQEKSSLAAPPAEKRGERKRRAPPEKAATKPAQ